MPGRFQEIFTPGRKRGRREGEAGNDVAETEGEAAAIAVELRATLGHLLLARSQQDIHKAPERGKRARCDGERLKEGNGVVENEADRKKSGELRYFEVTGMHPGGEPARRRTSLTDWAIPLPPPAMPVSRMTEYQG